MRMMKILRWNVNYNLNYDGEIILATLIIALVNSEIRKWLFYEYNAYLLAEAYKCF